MAAMPGTVGVDCPRGCAEKIECTLRAEPVTPKPGAKVVTVNLTVPDLADKMAAHYLAHHARVDVAQDAGAWFSTGFVPITSSPIPDDEVAQLISGVAGDKARVLVIADTVEHAKGIITTKNMSGNAIASSPRSIRGGAGRGLVLDMVLVDDRVWPLDEDVVDALLPCGAAGSSFSIKPLGG